MRAWACAAGAAVLAAVLAALAVLGSAPAHASCAPGSGPGGAPVIFLGSAGEERRGYTRFEVAEVWAGPDLAPEIWLLTGQQQPPWPMSLFLAVGSGNDAVLTRGERYVVGASESFTTDDCTLDASSPAAADALRPRDPRRPVAGGLDGADPPLGLLGQTLSVAGVLAALAGALTWRERRRAGASTA